MKKKVNPTPEQKKEKAIELMKQLKIYKPFIDDFKERDLVCYFEHCIGFTKNPKSKQKCENSKKNITAWYTPLRTRLRI